MPLSCALIDFISVSKFLSKSFILPSKEPVNILSPYFSIDHIVLS